MMWWSWIIVTFLGILRTSWHRVASWKSVMVEGFIEICKRYKPGLLSPLQLIIQHYPVYQWLLLSKNLVYTPALSLLFSSSSFFPPYTHFPSVLWILWQELQKKKKQGYNRDECSWRKSAFPILLAKTLIVRKYSS